MAIRDRIKQIKHLRNRYLICVLENPKLPINVAQVLRNISALGVEKLYIVGGYNGIPKTFEDMRNNNSLAGSSVGASKWTFMRHFDTTEECAAHLRKNGYAIAVTSPHVKGKENVSLYNGKFTQGKLAVWFGNESQGISDEAVNLSDFCISIPMGGVVESFNLGVSSGIVLSYIREQRLNFEAQKKSKKAGLSSKIA